MTDEKKTKFYTYTRTEFTCSKCECKMVVESDYLSEAQVKAQHKCRKGKGGK